MMRRLWREQRIARFCRGARPRMRLSSWAIVSCPANLRGVSSKSERRAARDDVRAYHGDRLAELVARVGEAVDRYRAGELDASEVDDVLYHYSRSAKELWKFCNLLPVETAATLIRTEPPVDWWEQGAPRPR